MTSVWNKEGESGLLDNFVFTINRSYFATNEQYLNGEQWLLQWEGTTDSIDVPTFTVWYNPGKGWVSRDGGVTIVHESGDTEKFFNKQSQYMKIISRCANDFGIAELLEKRGATPFRADSWVGFQFRMKAEPQPKVNNQEVRDKVFPVEFLGVTDGASASGGAAAAATGGETPQEKMARLKAERKAAANAEADALGVGSDASANGNGAAPVTLRDQVIAVLQAAEDFETAQAAAVEIEGVMDDDDLVAELMDPDGLYAQVKAGATA